MVIFSSSMRKLNKMIVFLEAGKPKLITRMTRNLSHLLRYSLVIKKLIKSCLLLFLLLSNMSDAHQLATRKADEALLAQLGYKQEFRREFTPFEVDDLCYNLSTQNLTGTLSRSLGLYSRLMD